MKKTLGIIADILILSGIVINTAVCFSVSKTFGFLALGIQCVVLGYAIGNLVYKDETNRKERGNS